MIRFLVSISPRCQKGGAVLFCVHKSVFFAHKKSNMYKECNFFVFHVKKSYKKNFVSREKVIIFAATSAKGQSKST